MSSSKVFFYFCLFFISGIFLDGVVVKSGFSFPAFLRSGILILGIALISVFWRHPKFRNTGGYEVDKRIVVIGFCLIFLFLGLWRHQLVELKIKNNGLKVYNGLTEDIVFKGTIVREPDIRKEVLKLTVRPDEIKGERFEGKGKILVTVNRYPEYRYGDRVRIFGKLKTPPVFKGFNYKNYLKKEEIYSLAYWPEIKLLERKKNESLASAFYANILQFKNKLRTSLYQDLPPPQSLILGAMILGDKNRMPEKLKDKLNIAGVRHITAVSGLHIVVLSGVLMSLLLSLGLWRGQAFYFVIIFIFLFIIMSGAQPSAIRAGIMGSLFILAQKIGRKSFSLRLIVEAAAFMLALNPLLLLDDVGFDLSFLAVMGIIYLGPFFKDMLNFIHWRFLRKKNRKVVYKQLNNLKEIIAMTLSAQVFTLPILIYNFGRISLVAPLTNVLIIPAVYWIMIFGFIFSLGGIFFPVLGWLLSFPALFLLTYLIKIVDFFSSAWAARFIGNVHWIWLIIFYSVLGVLVWGLKKKEKLKFLDY